MRTNLSLGKRIHIMRTAQGIERDEFARLVGVSPVTVSMWENDRSVPFARNLEKIKAILGWPSNDQAEVAFGILVGWGWIIKIPISLPIHKASSR